MNKNILIAVLVAAIVILLNIKGCERKITVETPYRTVDTTVLTDTFVRTVLRKDTVYNSVVLEKYYWDTLYKDSLYEYVSVNGDSNVTINERFLSKGEVVEHTIDWCVEIPEKIITNTVTIKEKEIYREWKKGFVGGLYLGYPFQVGGSLGYRNKKGGIFYVEKDFLELQNFRVGWMQSISKK